VIPPISRPSPQVLGRLPRLRQRRAVELPRGSGRHLGVAAPGVPQDPVPGEPAGAVQHPGTPSQRPRLAARRDQPGHAEGLSRGPAAPAAGTAGPAAAAAPALALPCPANAAGRCPGTGWAPAPAIPTKPTPPRASLAGRGPLLEPFRWIYIYIKRRFYISLVSLAWDAPRALPKLQVCSSDWRGNAPRTSPGEGDRGALWPRQAAHGTSTAPGMAGPGIPTAQQCFAGRDIKAIPCRDGSSGSVTLRGLLGEHRELVL